MPTMEQLVADHERLCRNLLNATEERNQIAIHVMLEKVGDAIFNHPSNVKFLVTK